MKPKFALLLAAVLTTFVLAIVVGVVRSLAQPSPIELAAGMDNTVPNVLSDGDVQATATASDQAYQQQLLEASQRIEEANRTIDEANARLQEPIVVREPAPAQQPVAQVPAAQPVAQAPAQPTQAPVERSNTPQYAISSEQAGQLALAAAPGASLLATPELVNYAGTPAYEARLDRGLVYIDANTGAVLANTAVAPPTQAPAPTNAPAPSTISPDTAASAAVAYLGGGTVVKVELEEEHGALVYEVRFANDSRVYVDAYSGSVVYAKVESGSSNNSGNDDNGSDDANDDHGGDSNSGSDDDHKDDDKKDDDKKDDDN